MRLNIANTKSFNQTIATLLAPAETSSQSNPSESVEQIALWMTNTLNCVPDALLATNAHGDVLFMNPRAEELTGWRIEEAIQQCSSDVFRLLDAASGDRLDSPLRDAYIEEQIFRSANCLLAGAGGDQTRIEYSAAPIRNEVGDVVGAVVVFRDKP